jgi:hypothetical protein
MRSHSPGTRDEEGPGAEGPPPSVVKKRKRRSSSSRKGGPWADHSRDSPADLGDLSTEESDPQLLNALWQTRRDAADEETPLVEKGCPLIDAALSAHGDNTWRSRFVARVSSILRNWRPVGEEWSIDYAREQDPLKTPQLLVSGPPQSGKGAAIACLALLAKKFGCFTVVLCFTPDFRNERARDLEARFLRSAEEPIPRAGMPRVALAGSTDAPRKKTAAEIKTCVMECGVVVLNYSEAALEALMEVVLQLRGGYGEWCGMVRAPPPATRRSLYRIRVL